MARRRIRKLLIANRGEIAVRIIRTCRELGIGTVAIFSEADRRSPHVRLADEAYLVGPAPSAASYLVQEKIIALARECGADAIHPGYGFLSENPAFALACWESGLIFVGPPAEAMRLMGDKTAARKLMAEASVPMAPGTTEAVDDVTRAAEVAREIGYPVLIKAAAGGGGKGMRLVKDPRAFERAMEMAQSEAASAFGDDRVFIEKYIDEPRHIEFQVLADAHGNAVHVFERDCSIQRRHQKVIEEAPSAVLSPELRTRMGEAAVEAVRACGYVNAGTVEFLVDRNLNFYFMEMNTRLQVEHPVTEWITGLDLVAEQIRIAEGEELGYLQSDLTIRGHAIEARVYAEDPESDFLPDPGSVLRHRMPSGPGVRVDAGVEEGGRVEMHYDPMISKLTVWAKDRPSAIRRMLRALDEYEIAGVRTTIPFCRFVMGHESFISGDYSTHFVARHYDPARANGGTADLALNASVAAVLFRSARERDAAAQSTIGAPGAASRWEDRRQLR